MKRTILIPTDFSIQSLNVLQAFLEQNKTEDVQYNIILLHGYQLSDSIVDLLFFSKGNILRTLISPKFSEACNVLRNKYSEQISTIKEDIFTGFTQSAFNNYTDSNQVEEIWYNAKQKPAFSHSNSFDFRKFIKRSELKTTSVQAGTITNLFVEVSY